MNVFAVVLAIIATGEEPRVTSVAVLPAKLLKDAVGLLEARLLDDALLTALQDAGRFRVIGRSDMDAVLGFEKQKDLLGCDSTACLSEIGAAFGVEMITDVSIARSSDDKIWSLAAKIIRVRGGAPTVEARLMASLQGGNAELMAALPGFMRELAAKAGLKVRPKSEVAFAPLALTSAPAVVKPGDQAPPTSLARVNLEAERLLERALDLEESNATSASEKGAAWCALAKVSNNPYQSKAVAACQEWTVHLESSAAAMRQFVADSETLFGYLKLKRKTTEQKLAVIDAYLAAYGNLQAPDLARAREYQRILVAGGELTGVCPSGQHGKVGCDPVTISTVGLTIESVHGAIRVIDCQPKRECDFASMQRGDTIVAVSGQRMQSTRQVAEMLSTKAGAAVQLQIIRDASPLVQWLEVPR